MNRRTVLPFVCTTLLLARDAAPCPQSPIDGTEPCDDVLRAVMLQAADGALGAQGWPAHGINSGTGAGETMVPGHVPCALLSSVVETESSWHQFGYVACGATAATLISPDCGYGLAQITSGMDGSGGFDPARVAGEAPYDVSVGVNILIDKWQAAPVVGDNDPHVAEDWYFALWGYNGFAVSNNPNEHPDTRGTYYDPDAPAYPRDHYPYEEIVYGYAMHPTAGADGQPRWPAVTITHPDFTQICPACAEPTGVVPQPTPTHAGDCVAPPWAAQFVAQSFPLASAPPIVLHVGESLAGYIELRNVGAQPWDAHTTLATTTPRGRASALSGPEWPAPDRLATVMGSVAPGASWRFAFVLHGNTEDTFDEHLGVVQGDAPWFSDPGQGGPPDDQLELRVQVVASAMDGGTMDAGAHGRSMPGCGCRAGGGAPSRGGAPWVLAIALGAWARRRRARLSSRGSRSSRSRSCRSG